MLKTGVRVRIEMYIYPSPRPGRAPFTQFQALQIQLGFCIKYKDLFYPNGITGSEYRSYIMGIMDILQYNCEIGLSFPYYSPEFFFSFRCHAFGTVFKNDFYISIGSVSHLKLEVLKLENIDIFILKLLDLSILHARGRWLYYSFKVEEGVHSL